MCTHIYTVSIQEAAYQGPCHVYDHEYCTWLEHNGMTENRYPNLTHGEAAAVASQLLEEFTTRREAAQAAEVS